MTQTRDLIKKMADFFTGEEFYEKGEDARLELSPDDVRCMNEIIKACGNAISRQAAIDAFERFIHELGIEDEPYNYGEMALSAKNVPPVNPQPISENIVQGFKEFTELMFKRGQEEREENMMFDHCKTCEHTDEECKDCYPELGYKNNKMKRDTDAVKKFTESDVFKQLMRGERDEGSN